MPKSTTGPSGATAGTGRRNGHWGWFAASFAVFFALAVGWAFASPVFSIPDENAHAYKALAQIRGQVIGEEVEGVKHLVVQVPEGFEYRADMLCFAFWDWVPASCAPPLGVEDGQDWFNTWVGAYNPIYYQIVGWPSLLFVGDAGLYAMRVASAALGALLLAWAFQAAMSGTRARWMPIGVAFAAAPMSVYLIGAVNPNGAELAAGAALWAGLLRLLESFDPDVAKRPTLPRPLLWTIVTVSAVMLANARATGPLWVVVVVALGLVAAGFTRVAALFTARSSYAWMGAIAVGGLFSLGWTYFGGSLSGQAGASDAPLVNGTFWQGATNMVRRTPDFLQQAIGYFGWFDAPLPVWAYWILIAPLGFVLGLAVVAAGRRSLAVLALLVVAALAVPVLVQAASVHQTGIIWQGRYGLFLYLGVILVATWLLEAEPAADRFAVRAGWIVPTLIGGYGVIAFGLVLVRYVIGSEAPFGEMLSDPQWQPPLGWPAWVAWYSVASLALVPLVGGAVLTRVRAQRSASAPAADPLPAAADA